MKRISLSGVHGRGKYALVDDEDYEWLSTYTWNLNVSGYVSRAVTLAPAKSGHRYRKYVYMHRLILDAPANKLVDHIDGDTTNNTRANLRLCDRLGNSRNAALRKDNTSGVKGVYKVGAKWGAHIKVRRHLIYLGVFDDKNQAAWAYAQAADRYFGEFVRRPQTPPTSHLR